MIGEAVSRLHCERICSLLPDDLSGIGFASDNTKPPQWGFQMLLHPGPQHPLSTHPRGLREADGSLGACLWLVWLGNVPSPWELCCPAQFKAGG